MNAMKGKEEVKVVKNLSKNLNVIKKKKNHKENVEVRLKLSRMSSRRKQAATLKVQGRGAL